MSWLSWILAYLFDCVHTPPPGRTVTGPDSRMSRASIAAESCPIRWIARGS